MMLGVLETNRKHGLPSLMVVGPPLRSAECVLSQFPSECDHIFGPNLDVRPGSGGGKLLVLGEESHQIALKDPHVNRLEDSLLLWKSIVSNKLLCNVNIVLFLNKCDLLQVCFYLHFRILPCLSLVG